MTVFFVSAYKFPGPIQSKRKRNLKVTSLAGNLSIQPISHDHTVHVKYETKLSLFNLLDGFILSGRTYKTKLRYNSETWIKVTNQLEGKCLRPKNPKYVVKAIRKINVPTVEKDYRFVPQNDTFMVLLFKRD